MQIHIHRHRIREITCDGTLCIDGQHICDTAEHSQYRPPIGNYRIVLRHNRAYGRKVPTLERVDSSKPSKTAVLAIGNGIYNRHDGRIILGTYLIPGCLKWSREPFKQLYDRINNSQRRGNEVMLRITESRQ